MSNIPLGKEFAITILLKNYDASYKEIYRQFRVVHQKTLNYPSYVAACKTVGKPILTKHKQSKKGNNLSISEIIARLAQAKETAKKVTQVAKDLAEACKVLEGLL